MCYHSLSCDGGLLCQPKPTISTNAARTRRQLLSLDSECTHCTSFFTLGLLTFSRRCNNCLNHSDLVACNCLTRKEIRVISVGLEMSKTQPSNYASRKRFRSLRRTPGATITTSHGAMHTKFKSAKKNPQHKPDLILRHKQPFSW